MSKAQSRILHASAAETADLSGAGVNFRPAAAAVILDITAVTGTNPTIDVTVEEYNEAAVAWLVIDTFPQEVGVALVRRVIAAPVGNQLRCSWVIGGTVTPTFTFSVSVTGKEQK